MGYIKHNSVIVTNWDEKKIIKARNMAIKIFDKQFKDTEDDNASSIISPIIEGLINSQHSFFIAPDGSKEGWDTSDNSDKASKAFLDWLDKGKLGCEYIYIRFGGDDTNNRIIRTNK